MSNTRKVLHQDIQTPKSGLKNEAQPILFLRPSMCLAPDKTLFPVLDIAYHTDHYMRRKGRNKVAKIHEN